MFFTNKYCIVYCINRTRGCGVLCYLCDGVIVVCSLSCIEVGTKNHFGHVYGYYNTLYSLSHGLFRTHSDIQSSRRSSLKETDVLLHIHRDCYKAAKREKWQELHSQYL